MTTGHIMTLMTMQPLVRRRYMWMQAPIVTAVKVHQRSTVLYSHTATTPAIPKVLCS